MMDFGVSSRQLSLYDDDTIASGGGGGGGRFGSSLEDEVDSAVFLGWGGDTTNNNNTCSCNSGNVGSSNSNHGNNARRGSSRGLSNRTIHLDRQSNLMSERSLSVNSLLTDHGSHYEELLNYSSSNNKRGGRQESVKTLDSNLEDDLVVEVEEEEFLVSDELLLVGGLTTSTKAKGLLLQEEEDRHGSTRALMQVVNNNNGDDHCSESSSSSAVGVRGLLLQEDGQSSTRAVIQAVNSDDHCSESSSTSAVGVTTSGLLQDDDRHSSTRAVIQVVNSNDHCSESSSTSAVGVNRPRGLFLQEDDRHSSTHAVILGASSSNDSDDEDITIATQPMIQSSSTKEDRRTSCTREESSRTLDENESVYSIDSKGFMAWKTTKSEEVVIREESMGATTTFDSGIQTTLNGEEESVITDCNSKLVEEDDNDEEQEKGVLLVDWDQSNKKMGQSSVNDCEGGSQVCQVIDETVDNTVDVSSRTLESNEVISNVTTDASSSDFNPTRIGLHQDDNFFGNRLTRRMRHVSNRLSSSLTSLRSSSNKAQAESREYSNSLPLDLSDSMLPRDDGLLVDWDQSEKEKMMGALLTLKDSEWEDGSTSDTNDNMMNQDDEEEDSDDKTLPIEIKQALESDDNITSGSSSNFQPTQIRVDKPNNNNINVGSKISNQMKLILMSPNRLSSSLTSPSSKRWTQQPPPPPQRLPPRGQQRRTWNRTISLPTDREYNHFRRSSTSLFLSKSDHGVSSNNNERGGGLFYLNPPNQKSIGSSLHSVPAISSTSLLCDDEEANRPIRLSREDNVNIEELRRELLNNAADHHYDELGKRSSRRRKSGFNMFAERS